MFWIGLDLPEVINIYILLRPLSWFLTFIGVSDIKHFHSQMRFVHTFSLVWFSFKKLDVIDWFVLGNPLFYSLMGLQHISTISKIENVHRIFWKFENIFQHFKLSLHWCKGRRKHPSKNPPWAAWWNYFVLLSRKEDINI